MMALYVTWTQVVELVINTSYTTAAGHKAFLLSPEKSKLTQSKPKSMSLSKLRRSLPFSGIFRKLEQDVETVIRVLQPGPVGIVEHKFTDEEICKANATVKKAVENWRRRANSEVGNSVLKHYIDI